MQFQFLKFHFNKNIEKNFKEIKKISAEHLSSGSRGWGDEANHQGGLGILGVMQLPSVSCLRWRLHHGVRLLKQALANRTVDVYFMVYKLHLNHSVAFQRSNSKF